MHTHLKIVRVTYSPIALENQGVTCKRANVRASAFFTYFSLECCEVGATPHTVGHILTVNPRSHGNLLLFQLISMLPQRHLLPGESMDGLSLSLSLSRFSYLLNLL